MATSSISEGGASDFIETPHVPHGWDAGVIYEEETSTLFCGDLFAHGGNGPAVTSSDILAPAIAAPGAGMSLDAEHRVHDGSFVTACTKDVGWWSVRSALCRVCGELYLGMGLLLLNHSPGRAGRFTPMRASEFRKGRNHGWPNRPLPHVSANQEFRTEPFRHTP